jgi:hypothetical protein
MSCQIRIFFPNFHGESGKPAFPCGETAGKLQSFLKSPGSADIFAGLCEIRMTWVILPQAESFE